MKTTNTTGKTGKPPAASISRPWNTASDDSAFRFFDQLMRQTPRSGRG